MNKIIQGVIFSVLGVLIITAFLIPVVNGYNDSIHDTYTYDGGYMAASVGGATTEITADLSLVDNTYTVSVNDKDVTALIPANDNQPIIMWSQGYIQVSGTNGTNGTLKAYFYDETTAVNKVVGNATHILVNSTGGVITATLTVGGTNTVYTSSYAWIGYANEDGTERMVLRDTTKPIYYTDINQIYVSGYTQNSVVTSVGEEVTIKGTATGNLTITSLELGNGAYSTTTNDIDFNLNGTTWNPLYLIIPAEITVTEEGAAAYSSLISIIPVLLIIGVVIAMLSLVIRAKN